MTGQSRRTPAGTLFAVVFAVAALIARGTALDGQSFPPNASPDPALERALRFAFSDAARLFSRDPCLRLLSEFRDAAGVELLRRLDQTGDSVSTYLHRLAVAPGDHRELCRSGNVLAGTRPGARVVYFCSRRFVRLQFHDPDLAAAVVIHEVLHTLGLPENPPSSQEITARVVDHCGDRARKDVAVSSPK